MDIDKPIAIGECHGKRKDLKQGQQKWSGNTSAATALGLWGNAVLFHSYRFALVMENAQSESYVTEKIGNAFAAGTIPIYYGTEHIFDIFSRQAFIFMDPFHPSEALAQIKHLEQNKTAYHEMMVRPIFANGQRTLEQYFSMTMHGGNKNGPGTGFERAAAAELGDAKVLKRVRQALMDMPLVPWPPPEVDNKGRRGTPPPP